MLDTNNVRSLAGLIAALLLVLTAYFAYTSDTFRSRSRRALEDGVLLAFKFGLVLAIYISSAYYLWLQVATLRLQAQQGAQAFTYLTTGDKYKQIDATLAPQRPTPSPSPSAKSLR